MVDCFQIWYSCVQLLPADLNHGSLQNALVYISCMVSLIKETLVRVVCALNSIVSAEIVNIMCPVVDMVLRVVHF